VNGGSTAVFAYDDDGLLIAAGAEALVRGPIHGLLTGTSLGSVTTSQAYNAFGELANESSSAGYANTYTRDRLGRIVQKVETIGGTATSYGYAYDLAGRLAQVSVDGAVARTYAYDANGNRLSVTDAATGTTAGTYDAQDACSPTARPPTRTAPPATSRARRILRARPRMRMMPSAT
jgi:YD repeat-containing protein